MKVLIATEVRIDRTPDGACWNVGSASYEFWRRYLDIFDEVGVVARLRDVTHAPQRGVRADGPNVSLTPLPYYIGALNYVRRYPALRRAARTIIGPDDAVIVRAPGISAGLLVSSLNKAGRPFGIEIVGDPHDVWAAGGVRTVLGPLLRQWSPRVLKRQCARACAAAYVTERYLQQRYPARKANFVTYYSSIDLAEDAFVTMPRPRHPARVRQQLVFVGSLEQLYKAPDTLIDALAEVVSKGTDAHLTVIGDGKERPALEAQTVDRGVSDRVRFLGHLPPGDPIRRELDAADLFILPSRTEGLPRALIEAMARALPCIGSNVGGIPELLGPSALVPAGDPHALAAKIVEVLADPEERVRLSRENLLMARRYHVDTLRPKRQRFYQAVRDATLHWQHQRYRAGSASSL